MNSCVTTKVHVLERHGINDNLKIFETYPKLSLGRLGTSYHNLEVNAGCSAKELAGVVGESNTNSSRPIALEECSDGPMLPFKVEFAGISQ